METYIQHYIFFFYTLYYIYEAGSLHNKQIVLLSFFISFSDQYNYDCIISDIKIIYI